MRSALIGAACLAALALGGCSSASPEPEAPTFFKERGPKAQRVGTSARAVEATVHALPLSPSDSELKALAKSAQQVNERVNELRSGWTIPEDIEGEELSTIETQIYDGAGEIKNAMATLVVYAGNPTPQTLKPYIGYIRRARANWNEGVLQLWHVVKRKGAPTV